jgi:hypothetical protein
MIRLGVPYALISPFMAIRPDARRDANNSFIISSAGLIKREGISSVPISNKNSFDKDNSSRPDLSTDKQSKYQNKAAF